MLSGLLGGPETGGAYVYDFDGEQWVETARIPSPWPVVFAGFGRQVLIDGDVALVNMPPLLYVFQEVAQGDWVQVDRLEAPDAPVGGRSFGGNANALTDDWLFVGTPSDDSIAANVGSVYVFRREGPTEFTFHQKIDAPDPEQAPRFGYSVATNGQDLFVGGPIADRAFLAQGAVYRFEYENDRWTLRQEIEHGDPGEDYFGSAMALHGDTLVVAAELKRTPTTFGAAYLFGRDGDGDWSQRARLLPETLSSPFGRSVAIDGQRVVVGSPSEGVDGSPLGAAHVFDLSCTICKPDLDHDGTLTIFDFLTFLNAFAAGDPLADFDGDGDLTLFDFLAFQNAFAAGCA